MADLLDYIRWRGDLPFSQVPPGEADALVFSALVYLDLAGIVREDAQHPIPLHVAANAFLGLADRENRVRVKADFSLLEAAADAPRFRDSRLVFYRSRSIEAEQTQFAAIGYLLSDGSAFLAFRGTDYTLVGWKEDFNMSFQDSVPAQREAAAYTEEFAKAFSLPLHLGGHSKGGNLAVFAAAKIPVSIQKRILSVYNLDGPGFTQYLMGDEGYLRMVPRIRTYIPESSIIGMLLEHEELYTVIKSRQVSILQHGLYSWEIMGGGFVRVKEMSGGARFIDRTIKDWIADMSAQERSAFVDALFDLLSAGGAKELGELLQPKSILAIFKALNKNDASRRLLTGEFLDFLRAASSQLRENKT